MKKMNLHLSMLFLSVLLFASCSSDDADPIPVLELRDSIDFEAHAYSRDVEVTTNVPDWNAQVDNPEDRGWCTVTPRKANGSNILEITVTANDRLDVRDTDVTVSAGGLTKKITVTQLGENPEIRLSYYTKTVESEEAVIDIEVTTNVEYDIVPDVGWIEETVKPGPGTYALVNNTVYLKINEHFGTGERNGNINFKQKGGNIEKELKITQKGEVINLGNDVFDKDILIPVSSGWASEHQGDEGIENTFDGDYETIYHSRWYDGTEFPVTLRYYFEDVEKIDYVTVHARPSGSNGHFKEFDVYASVEGVKNLVNSYDFKGEGGSKTIKLEIENPEFIEFVVHSGVDDGTNSFVSCGEMEFFQYNDKVVADYDLFTDKSCSKLKSGVTIEQINDMESPLLKNIAKQLFNNIYQADYIVQKYKATPSHQIIANELKIGSGFSRYENITGVFLPAGENIVFVENPGGHPVGLLLPDLMRQPTPGYDPDKDPAGWGLKCESVSLKEGANIITVPYDCNAYISYNVDNPDATPEVTVHFPMGKANGYFDKAKHTEQDWNDLLDNAVSPIMDMKGEYIHVAYPVEYFKMFAYGRGLELITNYDRMLYSHYTFMGLKKYSKMPKNRIFARVNFNYYMFRDGDGVAYLGNQSTMGMVINPTRVITGDPCWGFTHEAGHVLQMRPQTNWGGLGEVSNNWFANYTYVEMGNVSLLKSQGYYAAARRAIIEAEPKISYLEDNVNVFHRLVPFWQLHLYFSRNGKPEFYADLMEALRNRPHAGTGNDAINNQFEFIKLTCEIGEVDLTDFFEKWGFFYVGEFEVNDYGNYKYNVTQQMVDDTKEYITSLGKPLPSMDVTTIED